MRNTEKTKSAFTLVELIIVITILAILATIGFMSFQSYTTDARDGKRKRDLGELRNGLEIYVAKNSKLPDPDAQTVTIMSGGLTISTQGYAGASVLQKLRASDMKDSLDNSYYTYIVNSDKTKYQLLSMLENNTALALNNNLLNETYARDYTSRYAYTTGNKVGIFFSGTTNTPLQETMSGNLILTDTTNSTKLFKVMFSNEKTNSGTIISSGSSLPAIIKTETNTTATTGTNQTSITCPTGYVLIPGNSSFSTSDFCVMKYEAKNVSSVATSQSSSNPWVSITQPRAITACNNLGAGYHLITNNEWMTIARNIEANSQNWANGTIGSLVSAGGGLYRGNVNLNDSASCGSNVVLDGNTAGTNCDNGSGRNKRMHILSNGNEIWDISGNVREHVNGTNNTSHATGEVTNGQACSTTTSNRYSFNGSDTAAGGTCSFISPYSNSLHGPLGNYNADNGVGRIYSNISTNRIFIRGAYWNSTTTAGVFTLYLFSASTGSYTHIGFRCTFSVN